MDHPNLILITVECWRYDHLGSLTPNLVQLAEESSVFHQAYAAAGWTLPSMTAMMSSAYPSMFGGCGPALATPERNTLAEILMSGGYWTAGFVANPVCGNLKGFHRGFGKFREERRKLPFSSREREEIKRDWRKAIDAGVHPRELDLFCDAAHMTNTGLEWIETVKTGSPRFLWLHYMDPHWPCYTTYSSDTQELRDAWHDRHVFSAEVSPRRGRYDPGEEMRARWVDRYCRALRDLDVQVGRLIDGLKARPDWDNTVVAIMGDHGEEFLEHGTWFHSWNRLYREGIHVPLILRVPGRTGTRLEQPVSGLDIAPTLLDYAGIRSRTSAPPMMGNSLRPLIEGGSWPDRAVYTEMLAHPNSVAYRLAILEDGWKYIYDLEAPHDSQLFRVDADPGENENLKDRYPDIFRRFERRRFSHVTLGLTGILERTGLKNDEMDEAMKEQMVALGYLAADA